MIRDVIVLPTGTANLASVRVALERAGVRPRLFAGEDLARADAVVLPGVGAFDAGAAALDEGGWREALVGRVHEGRPTLGICLGMQLFASASEEGTRAGLGVVPATVRRLPDEVRLPHFGWNHVQGADMAGYAYFAHSFALRTAPAGFEAAFTTHGVPFVSALRRGAVCLCQFHPELSGAFGARVLQRWLAASEASS